MTVDCPRFVGGIWGRYLGSFGAKNCFIFKVIELIKQ